MSKTTHQYKGEDAEPFVRVEKPEFFADPDFVKDLQQELYADRLETSLRPRMTKGLVKKYSVGYSGTIRALLTILNHRGYDIPGYEPDRSKK